MKNNNNPLDEQANSLCHTLNYDKCDNCPMFMCKKCKEKRNCNRCIYKSKVFKHNTFGVYRCEYYKDLMRECLKPLGIFETV